MAIEQFQSAPAIYPRHPRPPTENDLAIWRIQKLKAETLKAENDGD
jgi:hypothetical protein